MASDGTIKIGTELDESGLKKGLADLGKAAQGALSGMGASVLGLQGHFNKMSDAAKKAAAEYQTLQNKVKVLAEQHAEAQKEVDKLTKAFNKSVSETGASSKETQELSAQLKEAEGKADGLQHEMDELTGSTKKSGNEFDQTGNKASEFGSKLKSGLVAAAKIGAAAIAAVGAGTAVAAKKINDCVNVYAKFDDSMKTVAATMGMTAEEIEAGSREYKMLENAAKQAGASTKFSASESADALNYLALAGYDAEKAVETLPKTLNLAAAGGMDIASTTDLVTDAMSALGLETKDLDMFVDQLAKTSQKSNTNIAQLGEGLLVCAGTATTTGQSLTTINTSLGILADNGIKSAEGGTHLRNILLSLSAPTDTAYKALTRLGLAIYDDKGEMRDLSDIMTDLNGLLSNMSQEEKTNTISAIFNKTDIGAVNALLKATTGRYAQLSAEIKNSAGAAAAMAGTMESGLAGSTRSFESALEGVEIEIGYLFASIKQKATDGATGIFQQFALELQAAGGNWNLVGGAVGNFIEGLLQMIAQMLPSIIKAAQNVVDSLLSALSAAIPTLLECAGKLILTIIDGIISYAPALLKSGAEILLNLISGILEKLPELVRVAIELIVILINAVTEQLPQLIPLAYEIVLELISAILENLPLVIECALQLILALAEGVTAAMPMFVEKAPELIDAWMNALVECIPLILEIGAQIIVMLIQGISDNLPDLLAQVPTIVENWVNSFGQYLENIKQVGIKIIIMLVNGILDKASQSRLYQASANITRKVIKTFKDGFANVAEIGKNIVYGIWNGISSAAGWLYGKVMEFASSILSTVMGVLGIHSPSTEGYAIGRFFDIGLANGISENESLAIHAAAAVSEGILSQAKTASEWMRGIFHDIGGGRLSQALASAQAAARGISGFALGSSVQNNTSMTVTQNFYSPTTSAFDAYRKAVLLV